MEPFLEVLECLTKVNQPPAMKTTGRRMRRRKNEGALMILTLITVPYKRLQRNWAHLTAP